MGLRAGRPRSAMIILSSRPTRFPKSVVSAIKAGHSRRKSAFMPRPLNRRLSISVSLTKSSDPRCGRCDFRHNTSRVCGATAEQKTRTCQCGEESARCGTLSTPLQHSVLSPSASPFPTSLTSSDTLSRSRVISRAALNRFRAAAHHTWNDAPATA